MLLQRLFIIGISGLVGTLCRYGLSELVARRFGESFPVGTLIVNLVGCFLAGVFFYSLNERALASELVRSAVMIGFLGGFTTFSAFALQSFNLGRDGQLSFALLYVLLSNLIGFAFVWLGYTLSRLASA